MANEINTQPSSTGNFVDSNGDTVNLVNLLIEKGTAEYVEFIGGYKQYGCKKIKLSLSNGTFNNLNQIDSHIDVYERV